MKRQSARTWSLATRTKTAWTIKRIATGAMAGAGLALTIGLAAAPVRAGDDDAARNARWQDLQQSIFGARQVVDGSDKIAIAAPDRAMDAALVPITITVKNPASVKGIYFIIDDNPAPLAAHVTFGPAGDPTTLGLRVRIDQYSYLHAIEETTDGQLYETHRFIKAAGGCSAPAGGYDDAALSHIGQMRLRVQNANAGPPREVQLLIRHPNFNGMQMDPKTQGYTPARYIKSADVTFDGAQVLHLDSDISLATDPAVSFGVRGAAQGTLAVTARDSDDKVFEHKFAVTPEGS